MRARSTEHHVARLLFAVAAACLLAAPAAAQDFPSAPIRIIVTVSAGGGVDTVTRIVADKMQQRLGQPVVVENRPGGGGNIAGETVFTAKPDGYTLLASPPNTITITHLLHKYITFDPAKFEPIGVMSKITNVLLVRQDFPAKTAQEFIAYARANPGKLNYASQGIGTTSHLTAELFNTLAGTKLVHIAYKGTAPALNDILAGTVDLMFTELATAYRLHQAGKARILAVTTDKRLPILPDIPTMEEAGVPKLLSDTWNAISAPPKTPLPVAQKLNAALNEALAQDDLKARFQTLNLTPVGGSLEETRKFVDEETRRWSEVVRAAGVEPE
jgi:tripartite-type tricarboxylate transporter receptor subunit TctC